LDGIPRFDSMKSDYVQPSSDSPKEPVKQPQAELVKQPSVEPVIPDTDEVSPEQEADMDSLVNLMQEMKRVQEVNRYQEGLTDEQRRKNAEAIMLKFAQTMGIGEEDYCSEDENL